MRLDQVLERIGAQIVKTERNNGRLTLFIRSSKDRLQAGRWKQVVEELLLACHEQKKQTWQVDLSKAFFVHQEAGSVRFLWRLIFTGDLKKGAESLGTAAMRSLSVGAEVTSMPLIGQVSYEFDPANGKMKGGHDPGRAAKARTLGLSGGNIQ